MLTFEQGMDIRCREVTKSQVTKFAMGDGSYRYVIIGTEYGFIHTTAGDVRTWLSASGARRFLAHYRKIWGND